MSPPESVAMTDDKHPADADLEASTLSDPLHPRRSALTSSMNNTAVSISLSTIGRDLSIEEIQLQWLVSAYPLSSGCLLLVFGRLADLHGRKKTFILGSLVLAAFTLGCGFTKVLMDEVLCADSVTLDILRGFQGIGAAATIPASLGILAHAFPPSRARALAFSTFAAGAPVGAALGMAVGGVMTQETKATWRSPFYLEAGVTALCLLGGILSFDSDAPSTEPDKRVDWLGAMLITAGLVLIVFVLGQGEIAPKGWATPYIIALLITGVLLIGLFVRWQIHLEALQLQNAHPDDNTTQDTGNIKNTDDTMDGYPSSHPPSPKGTPAPSLSPVSPDTRTPSPTTTTLTPPRTRSLLSPPPLMKVSLWRRANGRFAVMMCIAFLTWCSFLSWVFWAQLYYQNYIGYTPLRTVVRLFPMFISGIICNMIVAVLVGYIPVIYLIAAGTFGTSVAPLLFAFINPKAVYWAFGFPSAVLAVSGADFVFAAGTLFIAKVAEPHEQSLAGALFQTMTQIGTSLGVTVTTVIFNRVAAQTAAASSVSGNAVVGVAKPTLEAYKAAQWGSFAFGVLATLLSIVFFRGVGIVGHRKNKSNHATNSDLDERAEEKEKELTVPVSESARADRDHKKASVEAR
ncbi:hypothetical protein DXG03_004753 [Asterophora parasitica]|uniref:Major facilitator superfamily (MFS) profile domain-containing protein n=1 Tax=Asterophora parasitica TaxID=117018 RepID=A0A9P7KFK1_9AGAR|nr:hypothetical protein DXG03_004753 [Asterophora parasitica]